MRASKTGIVMFNMGGPATVPEVGPFLTRLFTDPEIIPLPLQVCPRVYRLSPAIHSETNRSPIHHIVCLEQQYKSFALVSNNL